MELDLWEWDLCQEELPGGALDTACQDLKTLFPVNDGSECDEVVVVVVDGETDGE
jgi:hypothetical protein